MRREDIVSGSVARLPLYDMMDTVKIDITGKDIGQIVTFACTSAGLSTTKSGGISSVPDLEAVQAKLNIYTLEV